MSVSITFGRIDSQKTGIMSGKRYVNGIHARVYEVSVRGNYVEVMVK